MNISQCEFCGRSNYLSDDLSCRGCGAPIPIAKAQTPMLVYDARTLNMTDAQMYQMLARPGVSIPVNIPPRSRISDFTLSAACVGASMIGKPRL